MILFFPGHKCNGRSIHIPGHDIKTIHYPWYDHPNLPVNLFDFCRTIANDILASNREPIPCASTFHALSREPTIHASTSYVLIGHSMGSQFVYWISRMLEESKIKVLCITIEGTLWGPFKWKKRANHKDVVSREKYIFQQIMKHHVKQTEPLSCQVVSYWSFEESHPMSNENTSRNQVRMEHEEYWKSISPEYFVI
jgi:hypothetical protein